MGDPTRAEIQKSERGTQHPADDLRATIDLLARIKSAVGFSPAARETVAQAMGFKGISGHASRKLGSLSHFGLVQRAGSGTMKISELGKSILMPTSDAERASAIADAARKPALYGALIERYQGQAVPTLLPNLLAREHGVFAGSSENAAQVFSQSMEFAGLLRNGVLYSEPAVLNAAASAVPASNRAAPVPETPIPTAVKVSTQEIGVGSTAETQAYTIHLDRSGRIATIRIPLPLSVRDLTKIAAWVRYMTSVVDDTETSSISAN